jgi:alkylation response protein AidB-like acyl-CoA dehydrogenase
MDLLLNEEQLLLRDTATKLAASAGPRRARELRDAGREIDRTAWSGIVKAGWLAALVAEEQDGLGLGLFDLALALEETGKQIVMAPLVEVAAAIWAVSRAADASHPARAAIAAKIVVPATTLPGQRYDSVASPALDPGAMALSGAVSFVAFGPSAELFLVAAKAGGEAILCLVPRDAAGLAIATTPNVDGSTSSTLTFSRVAVADDAIVAKGELAAATAAGMHELIVLATSAELLGVAEAALDLTVQYTRLREQFGRKIGSFQALQHRMANLLVEIEQARSAVINAAAAIDADRVTRERALSAAKVTIGRIGTLVAEECIQLHGGIGMTWELPLAHYAKRLVMIDHQLGDEDHHLARYVAFGRAH